MMIITLMLVANFLEKKQVEKQGNNCCNPLKQKVKQGMKQKNFANLLICLLA